MIRYALQSGGATLHLRPGCRPQLDGMGPSRALRFRQLTVDDTSAAAGCLLEKSRVPKRLTGSPAEGASTFYLCVGAAGRGARRAAPRDGCRRAASCSTST